jgi:hypothetical protein
VGAAGADRKSGGMWCALLYPTRKLAMQTHSFADRLFRSSSPRIVPGCLLGGEKRKSEKAQLHRGITLLVATPGHLLNHLTKKESLPLSLLQTVALSGLSSTRLITFWTGAALGGRCEADCPVALRVMPAFQSVLVSATVTSKLNGTARRVPSGDSNDGGWA